MQKWAMTWLSGNIWSDFLMRLSRKSPVWRKWIGPNWANWQCQEPLSRQGSSRNMYRPRYWGGMWQLLARTSTRKGPTSTSVSQGSPFRPSYCLRDLIRFESIAAWWRTRTCNLHCKRCYNRRNIFLSIARYRTISAYLFVSMHRYLQGRPNSDKC